MMFESKLRSFTYKTQNLKAAQQFDKVVKAWSESDAFKIMGPWTLCYFDKLDRKGSYINWVEPGPREKQRTFKSKLLFTIEIRESVVKECIEYYDDVQDDNEEKIEFLSEVKPEYIAEFFKTAATLKQLVEAM